MCAHPMQWLCATDAEMVEGAFARADKLARELDTQRGNVALVAFSDDLFKQMQAYAEERNKPIETLKTPLILR